MATQVNFDKIEEAREIIRSDLYHDGFLTHAKFSGSLPCLCGERIQVGEEIMKPIGYPYWIHKRCGDLDESKTKPTSKAFTLILEITAQATKEQAVWRDDLLELAKLAFLGKWSVDYWLEDRDLVVHILDRFGLHRLTAGWRSHSDRVLQKYAQKIEKEFGKRKGWICRICKRLIWVEKSVQRGIGPVCYKHSQVLQGGN